MDRVSDVLKGKAGTLLTIASAASVYDMVKQMVDANVGSLLVTVGGRIEGIVTERDYLRRVTLEGRTEQAFLETLAPAFTQLEDTAESTLFMEGAARLVSEHRLEELSQLGALMEVLEHRRALLGVLRASLTEPNVYLRIGSENDAPELRSMSLVAANYGLARRNLGAVSVIGPLRMDYPGAIIAVRQAASELSRFVAEVYDE